jgi:hypothetical protein
MKVHADLWTLSAEKRGREREKNKKVGAALCGFLRGLIVGVVVVCRNRSRTSGGKLSKLMIAIK